MSDCSSVSEEIEKGSLATEVESESLSCGQDIVYTYNDFESTSLSSNFESTSITTGVKNSLDSSSVTPTSQRQHSQSDSSALSLDHSSNVHSDESSNVPSHSHAEDFPYQCSTQPCNHSASHEFYSKKLALLKAKASKDTDSDSYGCHGNHNTTAQDFFLQRLESNRSKLLDPSVHETTTNVPLASSPMKTLMERLPPGQLERLRLEALKHKMSVMIEEVSNDLKGSNECTECQEQLRLLAEKEFISRKLKLITEPSILKRLEEHMYHKDSITMLGEVIRSCIRPSSTSETIWQALVDKLDSLQKEHDFNQTHSK